MHEMLRAAWKRRVSLRLVSLKLSNVYDGRFRSELPLEVSAQRQDARVSYSSENAYYTIETSSSPIPNAPAIPVTTNTPVDSYFIKSSILDLSYSPDFVSTNLDSRQMLNGDDSFVFYANVWQSQLFGGGGAGTAGTNADLPPFSAIANAFLASPSVTNKAPPSMILSNFVGYMSNYNQWADSNFTNTNLWRQATNYYFTFSYGLVSIEKALGLSTGTPK